MGGWRRRKLSYRNNLAFFERAGLPQFDDGIRDPPSMLPGRRGCFDSRCFMRVIDGCGLSVTSGDAHMFFGLGLGMNRLTGHVSETS
jgi:hypothetical protein